MAVDLTGRVALVTGGARGIGLGVARALLDAGSRVAIAARTSADLERAKTALDGGNLVSVHRCDVADADQVARLVDGVEGGHGGLDTLVCSRTASIRVRARSSTCRSMTSTGRWR